MGTASEAAIAGGGGGGIKCRKKQYAPGRDRPTFSDAGSREAEQNKNKPRKRTYTEECPYLQAALELLRAVLLDVDASLQALIRLVGVRDPAHHIGDESANKDKEEDTDTSAVFQTPGQH